jgi:hypothetical protein
MKINRDNLTTDQNKHLPDEIFVTIEGENDDAYRNTYDNREDAVDNGDHDGTLVATYRLVSVETLALRRSTRLVKVKQE